MHTETVSPTELPGLFHWSVRHNSALLVAVFLLLSGTQASAQIEPSAATKLHSQISLISGKSIGSIHLFGYADNREISTFGIRNFWPMGHFLASRFDYVTEVLPVVLLTGPSRYSADSRALTTQRSVSYGAGVTPIGARLLWRPGKSWKPYLLGDGGLLYFKQPALSPHGTHLNFSAEFGAGIQFRLPSQKQLSIGYSFYHFSNGDTGARNPALDSNLIYTAVTFNTPRIALPFHHTNSGSRNWSNPR